MRQLLIALLALWRWRMQKASPTNGPQKHFVAQEHMQITVGARVVQSTEPVLESRRQLLTLKTFTFSLARYDQEVVLEALSKERQEIYRKTVLLPELGLSTLLAILPVIIPTDNGDSWVVGLLTAEGELYVLNHRGALTFVADNVSRIVGAHSGVVLPKNPQHYLVLFYLIDDDQELVVYTNATNNSITLRLPAEIRADEILAIEYTANIPIYKGQRLSGEVNNYTVIVRGQGMCDIEGEAYTFEFGDIVNYHIEADTVAPVIESSDYSVDRLRGVLDEKGQLFLADLTMHNDLTKLLDMPRTLKHSSLVNQPYGSLQAVYFDQIYDDVEERNILITTIVTGREEVWMVLKGRKPFLLTSDVFSVKKLPPHTILFTLANNEQEQYLLICSEVREGEISWTGPLVGASDNPLLGNDIPRRKMKIKSAQSTD